MTEPTITDTELDEAIDRARKKLRRCERGPASLAMLAAATATRLRELETLRGNRAQR